jgi:RNA polymerase sigma-70 factor (ECF subfamily)
MSATPQPGSDPPGDEDEALLRQVREGREEALQQLYRRHAPLVFHLACRALDRAAAEEVVQDTFLAVWRRAADFDPARGSVRSWLVGIGRHRTLDELRARSRRPQAVDEAQLEVAFSAEEPLPDEALWREVQRNAVTEALAALPEPQRAALRLAFFADLTHAEVARTLKVPLGTAKTRIRSGLRLLERHLGGLVALLLVGLTTGGAWLLRHHTTADGRVDRALHLLADSQTKALRLVPPESTAAPETGLHAAFRTGPGAGIAVLTLSHFPQPPAGARHTLWIRTDRGWRSLDLAPPDREGKGLQILEAPWLAEAWPRELRITRETGPAVQPSEATVVAWLEPAAPSRP